MPEHFEDVIGRAIPRIAILDVGAMSEGQERYHGLIEMGLAEVTGFEPDPEQFERLQGRPGPYRYLPFFLGDGRPARVHTTRYPGCSSLLEPDPRIIDLFETLGTQPPDGNFHVVHTAPVGTTRLDELGLTADLLKIDVQGGELDVLRHGTATLADVLVVESEVEFVPLYKDQPLFGDVQCFLRDHGFVLHKLIDVAGRPFRPFRSQNPYLPVSQMLWADAVFVRDFSRLERYDEDALLKAAAILDIVYASYDLAAMLLAEHDRRTGGGLRPRYRDSLHRRPLVRQCLNLKDRP